MAKLYYSEYAIENIAPRVLTAYDPQLYYGKPVAIPVEDLIEANGLSLEYQYLRKNGRILERPSLTMDWRRSTIWNGMNIHCSCAGGHDLGGCLPM